MFFSTLSFYDNFAENVVIFVVMSLAFFQPKYLKCGQGISNNRSVFWRGVVVRVMYHVSRNISRGSYYYLHT